MKGGKEKVIVDFQKYWDTHYLEKKCRQRGVSEKINTCGPKATANVLFSLGEKGAQGTKGTKIQTGYSGLNWRWGRKEEVPA